MMLEQCSQRHSNTIDDLSLNVFICAPLVELFRYSERVFQHFTKDTSQRGQKLRMRTIIVDIVIQKG